MAKSGRDSPILSFPHPLFTPTALIVGDSIIRNISFFKAITRCFSGATVQVILDKLPGLLDSLPSSINWAVVHVGCNDMAHHQSEQTKEDFNALFGFIKRCGKSFLMNGPLPILSHGAEYFNRFVSLNAWLHSTCSALNFFKSSLQNKNFFVVVGNCVSEQTHITCGIPQGSILGPLSFTL